MYTSSIKRVSMGRGRDAVSRFRGDQGGHVFRVTRPVTHVPGLHRSMAPSHEFCKRSPSMCHAAQRPMPAPGQVPPRRGPRAPGRAVRRASRSPSNPTYRASMYHRPARSPSAAPPLPTGGERQCVFPSAYVMRAGSGAASRISRVAGPVLHTDARLSVYGAHAGRGEADSGRPAQRCSRRCQAGRPPCSDSPPLATPSCPAGWLARGGTLSCACATPGACVKPCADM